MALPSQRTRVWTLYRSEVAVEFTPNCIAGPALRAGEEIEVVPRDEFVRVAAERDRYRAALADLVRLKDGPRDDAYRAAKDAAWDAAREALSA